MLRGLTARSAHRTAPQVDTPTVRCLCTLNYTEHVNMAVSCSDVDSMFVCVCLCSCSCVCVCLCLGGEGQASDGGEFFGT